MKKIVIVDGGPRKNMNTAQLLQQVAEGAKSVGDVEVKTVRLYDLDYKGCMSSKHRISADSKMHFRHSWRRLPRRTVGCLARPSILAR